ncbi:hypothetical protein VLF92_24620 [Pseudomonas chengduensis]
MAELDIHCRRCDTPYPEVEARAADHDDSLIDVVVTCLHCGLALNGFISLDEMSVINPEGEEQSDD